MNDERLAMGGEPLPERIIVQGVYWGVGDHNFQGRIWRNVLIFLKKYFSRPIHFDENIFLHAKPWIPGGEKSIFTAVIH